jgi:hypothetical protein
MALKSIITKPLISDIKTAIKTSAGDIIRDKLFGKTSNVTKPTGPLASLDLQKYKGNDGLRYPIDVAQYGSYLQFNINIAERSSYTSSLSPVAGAAGAAALGGAANQNSQNQAGLPGLKASVAAGAATFVGKNLLGLGSVASAFISGGRNAAMGAAAKLAVGSAFGAGASQLAIQNIGVDRKTKRLAQAIFLYVPDTIQNQMMNQWDAASATEAMGTAGFMAQGAGAVGTTLSGQENIGGSGVAGEAIGKAGEASGMMGGGVTDLVLKNKGLALNPQVQVLYKAINNRTFQFDFKFTPKNQAEMEQVLNIITAFRFHAAPELGPAGDTARYFIPPSEFDITLMNGTSRNLAFPRYSTCVLEGIDVNYVTSGQFATYEDGAPIEIAMQLQFKEVEIMHKKLIEEGY